MADSGTDLEARTLEAALAHFKKIFFELIDERQIQGFYDGYLMRLKEVLRAKAQRTQF